MSLLTHEALTETLSVHPAPCLSLYQPTHRRHPENQQDPTRFRNQIKELESLLHQNYPASEIRALLAPFEDLLQDKEFWNNAQDGLAVLGAADMFRVIRLPQPVREMAAVGEHFHLKPLRRFLQSVDRFQVLGLNLHSIRLFEGTRHALDEVELVPGVPRTITEALGEEITKPHQTVASYGGVRGAPMHHGHGSKADDSDMDAERFFRVVDRAILQHYSRPSGLPLILAALPEHHGLFHQVSQNPFLLAEGIRFHPDSLSAQELQAHAWQSLEERYQARLAALGEEFEQASAAGRGSDDLVQVAKAAASGRVATLLIEADRQIMGRLDNSTGKVELAGPGEVRVNDVLDELGELIESMGGRVMVIPRQEMPRESGLAATFRF